MIEHDGAGRLPLVVVIAVASPPLASSSSPHRRHVVITSSPCRRNVVAMSSPCRRHVVAMSSPCCGHAVAMPSPFNCLAVGVPIHCCRHLVVLPSTHCQCLLPSFWGARLTEAYRPSTLTGWERLYSLQRLGYMLLLELDFRTNCRRYKVWTWACIILAPGTRSFHGREGKHMGWFCAQMVDEANG